MMPSKNLGVKNHQRLCQPDSVSVTDGQQNSSEENEASSSYSESENVMASLLIFWCVLLWPVAAAFTTISQLTYMHVHAH